MASDNRPAFALPAADLIRERLATALRNRAPLAADPETNAYRLVHGEGDGLPHLFIDRFADGAVIHLRDPAWMNPRCCLVPGRPSPGREAASP
jgi:23S rRNA G2069 N7-methylase RlmK/C1962 C5-methylase RlmI